ncbi:gliding motility-associated C-terminal domain-containing protein [Siphonobacter sp. SORGH_AS_1065]|uniref:gliding motility-associated C-terminal domain-containing protein n=1 Tax=Siphonobacter sp. SORGH_AS_1065 TaxID=3041795 RepID=UPI002782A49C|nr:gliding motility-associated C-terminal domain-containing protein [Siphonobacter sp. SORGH_AS_1065]MDQ1086945.1 gliding motility-associated-like protein [Siphonobacter sp. SORGH_AS_1065]
MKYFFTFLFACFLLLTTRQGRANHIVGGNFEMVATGTTPGKYNLYVNLFFDEIGGSNTGKEASFVVSIFRKSDNQRMNAFNGNIRLYQESITPLQYSNPSCAEARGLKTSIVRYAASIDLAPADYGDPQGYYIALERCCRNTATDNITAPGRSGMVFYMEFPALIRNGQPFLNSSPVFRSPNGEYICVNKPFSVNFGATDADGDELRYSLITPAMGYSTALNPNPSLPRASPYPPIQWADGFNENLAIPGNPALRVDPATGVLSVTASQRGLFAFTVQVDEYRNGQKIGSVLRDFQLLVVDCPDNTLPDPVITLRDNPNNPVRELQVCEDGFLELAVQPVADASYQWQKEGINIPGATTNIYQANSPGVYQVVISSTTVCSASKTSEPVTLILKTGAGPDILANVPLPACESQQIVLSTATGNYSYAWSKDGQTLSQTNSSLSVTQSGLYSVRIQNLDDFCTYTPSKQVEIYPTPQAEFSSLPSSSQFCASDSVALVAATGTGYTYQWFLNGQPISGATQNRQIVKASGLYTFEVKVGSCSATSTAFDVHLNPEATASLQPIPSICQSNMTRLTLVGTPAGGIFSGPGVVGNEFDPSQAGIGSFPITYTITNAYGCKAMAQQTAVVSPAPRLMLPEEVGFIRGGSIVLQPQCDDNLSFAWTPPTGLSSNTIKNPTASPTQSTRYTLKVTTNTGCEVQDDILVTVWEPITIPNGITPNGDGKNDTWEMPGIEYYPNAEVQIFNRWGTELFFSKGYRTTFDGTYQGKKLPVATYYYVIKPNNGRPTISGSLTIVY